MSNYGVGKGMPTNYPPIPATPYDNKVEGQTQSIMRQELEGLHVQIENLHNQIMGLQERLSPVSKNIPSDSKPSINEDKVKESFSEYTDRIRSASLAIQAISKHVQYIQSSLEV